MAPMHPCGEWHMAVSATRDIEAGEEILLSVGSCSPETGTGSAGREYSQRTARGRAVPLARIAHARTCKLWGLPVAQYGDRHNDDFIVSYGFVPLGNPHDDVLLFPSVAAALEWFFDHSEAGQVPRPFPHPPSPSPSQCLLRHAGRSNDRSMVKLSIYSQVR